MSQLLPPHDQDVLPGVEIQIGGVSMTTWSKARNAAILVATAMAIIAAHVSAASAEIIPLVTIAIK